MGKKSNKKRQKQQSNQRGYSTNSKNASTSSNATTSKSAAAGHALHVKKNKPAVSGETHQDLQKLLESLSLLEADNGNDNGNTACSTSTSVYEYDPDRFWKKLVGLHATLDHWGFSLGQMERAVAALGYGVTLESALDWLCLHLDTQELPPLFTEGTVRLDQQQQQQQQASASSGPLAVHLVKPVKLPEHSVEQDTLPIQQDPNEYLQRRAAEAPNPNTKDSIDLQEEQNGNDKASEESKAWILQQYQYEEEGQQDDQDHAPPSSSHLATETETTLRVQETPQPHQIVTSGTAIVDPQEKRLAELQTQLQEQEADLHNDANNYMRSKQEIKQLQNSTKKLRQQVQKLKKRVEQKKAQEEEEAAAAVAVVAPAKHEQETEDPQPPQPPGDDYGGGLFGTDNDEEEEAGMFASFFDQVSPPSATTDTTTTIQPGKTAPTTKDKPEQDPPSNNQDPVVPLDSIPKGWTGKTPQQILQDWCQKNKIKKRPQFFQLRGQNGARVRVDTQPDPIKMETNNAMPSYKDAQQYLATKVLYQLEPDLPLYRIMPPFYRDLWRSWMDAVKDEQELQQREVDDALRAKIQQLADAAPKPKKKVHQSKNNKNHNNNKRETQQSDDTEDLVRDTWEDDDDDDQPIRTKGVAVSCSRSDGKDAGSNSNHYGVVSRAGKAIQDEFLNRQQQSTVYQSMLEARKGLPMYSFRDPILEAVDQNPVTILCAETGAGKTTQCPQFILEEAFAKGMGDKVSVLCTQPRRVAATSVAERVSEEMGEPALGQTVGYQIRLEAKRSSKTRLLFCTTGVVLRRLQDDPLLKGISHVCVDEVHERQYQVDCLLVMLRKLLRNGRPDLKVILMSATLDAKLFASFFGGAPVLNVPGRTFPVSTFHMEDMLDATNHIVEEGSRYALREDRGHRGTASIAITTRGGEKRKEMHSLDQGGAHSGDLPEDFYPGYKMSTRRSMTRVNEEIINYDLIEDVLHLLLVQPEQNDYLLPPEGADLSNGAVLVFLPGFGEIRALTERLAASSSFGNKQRFDIIPMHSTLSPQDQRRAFLKPRKGCRKLILATNIAETSVTIPDVVCVIDAGRVREVRVDKRTSTSRLVTDWCSQASAKQRAGRAGRVQPGICLKLYSSWTDTATMKENAQPEIRRVPLEDVCLSILAGSFASSCMEFLQETPQPPAEEAVRSALRILCDVGAISLIADKTKGRESEQLTPLGRHLARLPVDVRLGKILLYGSLFKCIDPVLTAAASLSCKSPFSAFVSDALQAKAKHKQFWDENSDFLTLCNVWEAYEKALSEGVSKARSFCYENYLSFSALREIADTRRHFMELLMGIGFLDRKKLGKEADGGNKRASLSQSLLSSSYNANTGNVDVVHSVICAGLYPNVGYLAPNPSGSGERQLWHRNERLFFHSASVNAKLKTTHRYPTSWIAFHEKFGTQHRTSVSTTCFIHPFAMLLFGGTVIVKHTERKVIIDDWIEVPMAAQSGVMFREVRAQVEKLLQSFHMDHHRTSGNDKRQQMVDGVIGLLSTETGTIP
ncbi:DExH-box ATP-dependent RNA helicase DExH7, chloroplastic [Seminavis robusta]|uniref:RNA helicase n=1 Tax=Seminavis robusta TaxID=568900 RepID=A0A9N8HCI5_9STRA|nr:DExH-box ATP-dependent RNA helicase DExH7, chloroplastic [Seminavis robusta]|eukprot:Sro303_g112430.1 DExH-box ATP-dependent RNA helicase DExH7, chloroplastic (1525) ;mRNA; r:41211-46655